MAAIMIECTEYPTLEDVERKFWKRQNAHMREAEEEYMKGLAADMQVKGELALESKEGWHCPTKTPLPNYTLEKRNAPKIRSSLPRKNRILDGAPRKKNPKTR